MQTTQIDCFVLRRSENTNSFGLRGVWLVEYKPIIDPQTQTLVHRVWSFVVNYLDEKQFQLGKRLLVPFWLNHEGEPSSVGIGELSQKKRAIPHSRSAAYIGMFSHELKEAWVGEDIPERLY